MWTILGSLFNGDNLSIQNHPSILTPVQNQHTYLWLSKLHSYPKNVYLKLNLQVNFLRVFLVQCWILITFLWIWEYIKSLIMSCNTLFCIVMHILILVVLTLCIFCYVPLIRILSLTAHCSSISISFWNILWWLMWWLMGSVMVGDSS